jgi:hypothetical protein
MFSGFKSVPSALRLASKQQVELTSVDNTLIVEVFDCASHCPYDILGIPTTLILTQYYGKIPTYFS